MMHKTAETKEDAARIATAWIANRALEGENAIRQRFTLQKQINERLIGAGLPPLVMLSIGQPHIAHAPTLEWDDLATGYSDSKGRPEFIRYVTALYNERITGLNATDDNVLITPAGPGALAALAATLIEPGRTILALGSTATLPGLQRYKDAVLEVPAEEENGKVSPETLRIMLEAHHETVSFIVLDDFLDPQGTKYTKAELQALGKVLEDYPNVLIFSDERCHDLAPEASNIFFLEANPKLKHRTIVKYSTEYDLAGEKGLGGAMVYAPVVRDQFGKEINLAVKMAGQQLNMCTAVSTLVQKAIAELIEATIDRHYNTTTKQWEEGADSFIAQQNWLQAARHLYPTTSSENIAHSPLLHWGDMPEGESPAQGWPEYLRYVTALYNARIPGLKAKDENVLFTAGGTGALATVAASLLDTESTVLFPVPGFAAQLPALRGYGATVVEVPTDQTGFKLTAATLRTMLELHPNTKLLVLNDITNPTGAKYSENELREIGTVLEDYPKVMIFSDETYHDLASDKNAKFFLEINPQLKHRTIVEYSTAKDLIGEPGLRGGMVYAPKEIAQTMTEQQRNMCTAVSTLVQKATAVAIEAKLNKHYDTEKGTWEKGGRNHEEYAQWERGIQRVYRNNLKLAEKKFKEVGISPLVESGGGFFLFVNAGEKFLNKQIPDTITGFNGLEITGLHKIIGGDTLDTDTKIATFLAYAANIMMVEGGPFGTPSDIGALRVSVATSKRNLKQIPDRIRYAEQCLVQEVAKPMEKEGSWELATSLSSPAPLVQGNDNNRIAGTINAASKVQKHIA